MSRVGRILALPTVVSGLIALGLSGTSEAANVPSYQFTQVHPPLLKDFHGDIYAVPVDRLRSELGRGTWDSPDGKTQYRAVHYHRWVLVDFPHRYATDVSVDVEQTQGYDKKLTDAFTKEIGGEAGGDVFGISAKVTGSLKFDKETVQTWSEQKTVKMHREFKGEHTYCTWELVDLVTVDRVSVPENPKVIPPQSKIADVLTIYEDDAADPKSEILTASLAAAFVKTGTIGLDVPVEAFVPHITLPAVLSLSPTR